MKDAHAQSAQFRTCGIPVAVWLVATAWLMAAGPAHGETPVAEDGHPRHVIPFLKANCSECHAGDDPDSGVSLDALFQESDVEQNRTLWQDALKQLRAGAMPPAEAPRPDQQQVELITAWIDSELFSVDCDAPVDPGLVTIRRLNRVEYGNTIRDLLGVEFRPSGSFPTDELGAGYDNNGDALTISPLLMEKYLDAAARIAAEAIPAEEDAELPLTTLAANDLAGGGHHDGARVLTSHGEITATWTNDRPGLYKVRIEAFGDQAGDEPANMQVTVDGRQVREFAVPATRDKPQTIVLRLPLQEGQRRLGLAFTNDYYVPEHPDPARRDRNLWVGEVQVIGPIVPPNKSSAFYRSIEPLLPPPAHFPLVPEDRQAMEAATREILASLLPRAYRRPVEADQIERLTRFLVTNVEAGDSYSLAMQRTLQVVLISPKFLFRDEAGGETQSDQANRPIDEFALASRLSYFLWSSMPDETLHRLAAEGQLRANLAQQVTRMLADEKSQALIDNFAGQWLHTRQLQTMTPDAKQFDGYDEQLAAAMRAETLHFFAAILREKRPLVELLDADYTYLNERLARHYGIDGVEGEQIRRVKLSDRRRGGVITQAAMLTLTSNPTRTSPVKRGKWILEQILGDAPPPAPANVPELEEAEGELTGTLRERLEQHRTNEVCASCHRPMDPLGFALENFDAIGRWRDTEGKFPIDAVGELPDGSRFEGPVGLKQLLVKRKDDFRKALARQLLTYALGRGLEHFDVCAVDEVCQQTKEDGDTLAAMVVAIAESDPFQFQRAVRPEELRSEEQGATR